MTVTRHPTADANYAVTLDTGEVVGASLDKDTYTSGSGSVGTRPGLLVDGVVHGSTSIQTKIVKRTKFFLRHGDGSEASYVLPGDGVAVRDGHLVTVGLAHRADGRFCRAVALTNHTTGKRYFWDNRLTGVHGSAKDRAMGWGAKLGGLVFLGYAGWGVASLFMGEGLFRDLLHTLGMVFMAAVYGIAVFAAVSIVATLVLRPSYRRRHEAIKKALLPLMANPPALRQQPPAA